IVAEAFDGAHLALVAGDREGEAGAPRLAVDQHGAGAAHAVLAAEMGAGEVAPLAQKVGERQPRRHVVGHRLAVHAQADATHASTCDDKTCFAARTAIAVCRLNWNSSKDRAVRSSETAHRQASRSPPLSCAEVRASTIGGPSTAPSTRRA